MPIFNSLSDFYRLYEMPLQAAFFDVENRGISVDTSRLHAVRDHINSEMAIAVDEIRKRTGRTVCVYAADRASKSDVCLNSNKDIRKFLKDLKYKLPTSRYTHNETANEAALQELYAKHGDEVLRLILRIRELAKAKGTYVDAVLLDNILHCSYIVAGTVGGRRSSRKHFLDIGTNGQNLPKHSVLGKLYRRCLVARPGRIFIACDQRGAEDWIVQAMIADNGGSPSGLQELQAGINRHRKLASFLFAVPEASCTKDSLYYFLGKKTRHAGNYDMHELTMAQTLTAEGINISSGQQFSPENLIKTCDYLLGRFHQYESGIKQVFHSYIRRELDNTQQLATPIGRRRMFFGLRDYADNNKIYREAYSYIPQSTVGDNTGLSILALETGAGDIHDAGLDKSQAYVIADGHDAVYLECREDRHAIDEAIRSLSRSFARTLRFPNGVEISIPVEFEMGYNLAPQDASHEIFEDGNPDGLKSFNTVEEGLKIYDTPKEGQECQDCCPKAGYVLG